MLFVDLPSIIAKSSNDYHYLMDLGKEDKVGFTVSILSKHVRFSITEKPDWRNAAGFLIGLDEGSSGNKYVFLKYCSLIFDGSGNDECETKVTKVS